MVILWLWSCLIVGLCSAHCKKENIIFTGDDKSVWVADIKGESKPEVLAPKKIAIFVNRDEGHIKVTVGSTSGAVRLLAVSLETKNFQNIDVLGQTKTLPSDDFNWVTSSFTFKGNLVDKITVLVKTDGYEAALRSIYVKACVVKAGGKGPKPLEKKLKKAVNDLLKNVQSEDYDKIRELFYTDDVIQVIQGEDKVQKGKKYIEERLRRIIPRPAFWEIEFVDSGRLSKTTAYSSFETRYYKDKTRRTIPKPIYRLVILWKMEDKRWKIDHIALNDDGAQCGQLTLKKSP